MKSLITYVHILALTKFKHNLFRANLTTTLKRWANRDLFLKKKNRNEKREYISTRNLSYDNENKKDKIEEQKGRSEITGIENMCKKQNPKIYRKNRLSLRSRLLCSLQSVQKKLQTCDK